MQQYYVIDSYIKVEGNRLLFTTHNKRSLRVETYLALADQFNILATETAVRADIAVILLSSLFGSPSAIHQNFHDVKSIVM